MSYLVTASSLAFYEKTLLYFLIVFPVLLLSCCNIRTIQSKSKKKGEFFEFLFNYITFRITERILIRLRTLLPKLNCLINLSRCTPAFSAKSVNSCSIFFPSSSPFFTTEYPPLLELTITKCSFPMLFIVFVFEIFIK